MSRNAPADAVFLGDRRIRLGETKNTTPCIISYTTKRLSDLHKRYACNKTEMFSKGFFCCKCVLYSLQYVVL